MIPGTSFTSPKERSLELKFLLASIIANKLSNDFILNSYDVFFG